VQIAAGNYTLTLKDNILEVSDHATWRLTINPVPAVDCVELAVDRWQPGEHKLTGYGNGFTIQVSVENDKIAYAVKGSFAYCERVDYFGRGTNLRAALFQSFNKDRGNQFETFSPMDVSVCVSNSPVGQRERREQQTWQLAPGPRACSYRHVHAADGDKPWLGYSIPGALPVGATVLRQDGSVTFEAYYAGNQGGNLPTVYLLPGLSDSYEILARHAELSAALGWVAAHKPYYEWWSRPLFCTWGEEVQLGVFGGSYDLTPANVMKWVSLLRDKTGNREFTVILDATWASNTFDWKVNPKFGSEQEMRNLIERLHGMGHKVKLWFCPFDVNDLSFLDSHPEGLVRNRDGSIRQDNHALFHDYTHPSTRERIRKAIRYMLSAEEGGLNADGLKVDLNFSCPDPRLTKPHDPSWGVGDQLWRNVLQLIHESAHSAKEDALVSFSGVEPYMQPFMDMFRLNDEFTESTDAWLERGRKGALCLPNTLMDSDGWYMLPKKAGHYWMQSPVFAVPDVYHATLFDAGIPIAEQDYRRWAAAWQVYRFAPITPDMKIVIDPDNNTLCRFYQSGAWNGFYSAICVNQHCLVTYANDKAYAASAKDAVVAIPLPPGWTEVSAVRHFHDGRREPIANPSVVGSSIVLEVYDAGHEVRFIELMQRDSSLQDQ